MASSSSTSAPASERERPPRYLLVVLVVAGIVLPGVANYALSAAHYEFLGTVVWVTGYLGMVLAVWYGWVRPLEFTGPDA